MTPRLDDPRPAPRAAGMLLVCILSVAAPLTHWGNFAWEGLVLLLGALALAVFLHVRPQAVRVRAEHVLFGMVLAFLAIICCLSNGMSETRIEYRVPGFAHDVRQLNPYGRAIKIVAAGALLLALTHLIGGGKGRRFPHAARFALLVTAAVAVRILILYSSPSSGCDVFRNETDAARALILRHQNLYTVEFKPPDLDLGTAGSRYGLAYPPTALYPPVLSWALFKDVRVGWVLCDLAAALAIYRLARRCRPGRPRFAEWAALAFLFLPRSLFILENGWVEPLTAAALGGVALALATARGAFLTGLLLGVWITSKQYVVLGLPLLARLRRAGVNAWLWAVAAGLALTLPFILWDVNALIDKTLLFFVESPGRADSLSLYGACARYGLELPGWFSIGLWLLAMLWITWKMHRSVAGWLFSTATVWLVFFALGKQAFVNYYYFISFTLLLAAAATPEEDADSPSATTAIGR